MIRAIKKPFSNKALREYSTRWLEHNLDELTSSIVLFNEKVCFIIGCGVRKDLQCGHLLERRHRHTRWDIHPEGNCHAQCPLHNQLHEQKPELYRTDFVIKYGQTALDELEFRSRSLGKLTYTELVARFHEYQEIWKRLRGKAA
jgi:hypothetical protein